MQLVKGDFWRVLIVLAFTQGFILVCLQILSQLSELYTESGIIISIAVLQVIFQILTGPVSGIAPTIMYLVLNDRKQIDMFPSRHEEGIEIAEQEHLCDDSNNQ